MAKTKLTPVKERAALLIAEGWTQADAARKIGKWPQTISRWMTEDEDFVARISELCSDLTSQAMELLRESILENTEIVLKIAKVGGESGVVSSQLKAALWAIERVLGVPAKLSDKRSRADKSIEAELLKKSEEELQELAERGAQNE
ncbi:hypothetical protein LCGC14_2215750 [marine sediment metagenome]|uniref:Uncharacterized protein n=1 Tax=marine sediment metagenome TaxID=412755 RepID=A0A0F9DCE3_9ZZZZ